MAQVPAEPPKTPEKKEEQVKTEKDTTSLHKAHLFDLHCKICTGEPLNTGSNCVSPPKKQSTPGILLTSCVVFKSDPGRMVAPVEEAPTKVVKVATTVARRPSAKSEEAKGTTPPAAADNDLRLTVLEESFRSVQSGYEGRSADAFRFFVFFSWPFQDLRFCFSTDPTKLPVFLFTVVEVLAKLLKYGKVLLKSC